MYDVSVFCLPVTHVDGAVHPLSHTATTRKAQATHVLRSCIPCVANNAMRDTACMRQKISELVSHLPHFLGASSSPSPS